MATNAVLQTQVDDLQAQLNDTQQLLVTAMCSAHDDMDTEANPSQPEPTTIAHATQPTATAETETQVQDTGGVKPTEAGSKGDVTVPPPNPYGWRPNEADRINLDRLDTSRQWIQWFTETCDSVASASGRPDECYAWMMEIDEIYESPEAAWDYLSVCGGRGLAEEQIQARKGARAMECAGGAVEPQAKQ